MIEIVTAAAALSGLGLAFGVILAWCSHKFQVAVDPRIQRVTELLPGVNCGGCGFPGCANFAEALVSGTAQVSACSVCSAAARQEIAAVLSGAGTSESAPATCSCGVQSTAELRQAALGGAGSGSAGAAAAKPAEATPDIPMCVLCSASEKKDLAQAMGTARESVPESENKQAVISCGGGNRAKNRFEFTGMPDCRVAVKTLGGQKECDYACVEQGTCMQVCPVSAISMQPDGVPAVDPSRCIGCGKCVAVCPRKIISMIPRRANILIRCSSHDKGAAVMKKCKAGCIGCGKCVKTCPEQAISLQNSLATIDYQKCTGCLNCVGVCPTKCIQPLSQNGAAAG